MSADAGRLVRAAFTSASDQALAQAEHTLESEVGHRTRVIVVRIVLFMRSGRRSFLDVFVLVLVFFFVLVAALSVSFAAV